MSNINIPVGALVTATLYGAEGDSETVTGIYRPREEYPEAEPPADAAWVRPLDDGPLMVKADSIKPARPVGPSAILRPVDFAGLLFGPRPPVAQMEPEPDQRHQTVEVRVSPFFGEPGDSHVYRDDRGLTWQTYGQEHDFSTDRLLEVVNSDGDQVACYPPGKWMHVRYTSYLANAETVSDPQ